MVTATTLHEHESNEVLDGEALNLRAAELRELTNHENELINHRLTWFLTIQGFLVAAVAFAAGRPGGLLLMIFLTGLSCTTCISIGLSLQGSRRALHELDPNVSTDKWVNVLKGKPYRVKGLSRDQISRLWHLALPWNLLPWVFMIFWIFLLTLALVGGLLGNQAGML